MSERLRTYDPRAELGRIKAQRHEVGNETTRKNLGKLREQIEVNRLFLTRVLTALVKSLEQESKLDDEPINSHQLQAIIAQEQQILQHNNIPLDELSSRFIEVGIKKLLEKRQKIRQTLQQYGQRRVLAMLMGYSLGELTDDENHAAFCEQKIAQESADDDYFDLSVEEPKNLDEVVPPETKFRVELGAVNYDVFISREEATKLELREKDDNCSGYARCDHDEPFSVIFTYQHDKMSQEQQLLRSLFNIDYPTKTRGHETQHQLEIFIKNLSADFFQNENGFVVDNLKKLNGKILLLIKFVELNASQELVSNMWAGVKKAMEAAQKPWLPEYENLKTKTLQEYTLPEISDQLKQMHLETVGNPQRRSEMVIDDLLRECKTEIIAFIHNYDLRNPDGIKKHVIDNYLQPKQSGDWSWSDRYGLSKDKETLELVVVKLEQVMGEVLPVIKQLASYGYKKDEIANLLMLEPIGNWRAVARKQKLIKDKIRP